MNREKHRKLLNDWRERPHHSNQIFVSDGPIDWDRWSTVNRRVLFLAKEAPGYEPSWDLPEWIREEGPKFNIWWNVAYWAYGIQRVSAEYLPSNPVPEEAWDEVKEALLASAVVNVKKSGGKSSSDVADLRKYVQLDGDLIKQQVECYTPHVIVCCRTWSLVKSLWGKFENVSEHIYRINDILVLDYYHPSARFPIVMHYYTAMVLIQQALREAQA